MTTTFNPKDVCAYQTTWPVDRDGLVNFRNGEGVGRMYDPWGTPCSVDKIWETHDDKMLPIASYRQLLYSIGHPVRKGGWNGDWSLKPREEEDLRWAKVEEEWWKSRLQAEVWSLWNINRRNRR